MNRFAFIYNIGFVSFLLLIKKESYKHLIEDMLCRRRKQPPLSLPINCGGVIDIECAQMDGLVKQIVAKTIKNTDALLMDGKLNWDVAREGIIRIVVDLCEKHPHSAVAIKNRFEQFIVRNDMANSERLGSGHLSRLSKRRRHARLYLCSEKTTMRIAPDKEYVVALSNLSVSGAEIKTNLKPLCGSDVIVGSVPTTVVRHFAEGIGCQFLHHIADEDLRETFRIQQSSK
jgi:hypothetical protein